MRNDTNEWRRLHRIEPPVTIRVVASPVSGWLVRIEGWEVPEQFPLLYPSLEAAQRAADDVLLASRVHDCRQTGCDDWTPVTGPGLRGPDRPM